MAEHGAEERMAEAQASTPESLQELLTRAETLEDEPLPAHADLFEQIHADLQNRLREADA